MPATITVTGNCIDINGNLYSKASLAFTRTNVTTYQIVSLHVGALTNLTAANTTLNSTTYPTIDALFTAFKTTVF